MIDIPYQIFLRQNANHRQLQHYNLDKFINFASNDYLNIAKHPLLIARSHEMAQQWGVGTGSSRLVSGNFPIFEKLETQIATALGKPAALIMASGYQTNISILAALLDQEVLAKKEVHVFADRYCHNSLLSLPKHVKLRRFLHQDCYHLNALLAKHSATDAYRFIVAESLYSMDGDIACLPQLIHLAKQYHAFLYVDDAHAVGIYGHNGWGFGADYVSDVDLVMGTFSKALGSFGGYIACSESLRDYFINKCRGLIYSTALSPAVLGAIAGAIELLPQLTTVRENLQIKAKNLRDFFAEHHLNCGLSTSHIIPWIIADGQKTLHVAELLREQGILAVAIRSPTVPAQQSRIRICLNAGHSSMDCDKLKKAILIISTLLKIKN